MKILHSLDQLIYMFRDTKPVIHRRGYKSAAELNSLLNPAFKTRNHNQTLQQNETTDITTNFRQFQGKETISLSNVSNTVMILIFQISISQSVELKGNHFKLTK